MLSSLFDIANLKSGFASTFKKRSNNGRTCLLLIGIKKYEERNVFECLIIGVCFLIEMFLITGKGDY